MATPGKGTFQPVRINFYTYICVFVLHRLGAYVQINLKRVKLWFVSILSYDPYTFTQH